VDARIKYGQGDINARDSLHLGVFCEVRPFLVFT